MQRCRTAKGLFGRFHRWNCGRQIRKVSRAYRDPLMANAAGERKVLAVLLKLDDGYHVLCEVSLTLPHFVWYNGACIDK